MRSIRIATSIAALAALVTGCTDGDDLTTFRVEIENLSEAGLLDTTRADGAMPLSQGVYAVYADDNPLFTVNGEASSPLQLLAEDGIAAPDQTDAQIGQTLLEVAEQNLDVLSSGVITALDDGTPGIAPGSTATITFQAEEGEELQIAMMLVQTNDWFLAFEDGGLPLFDTFGQPVEGDVTGELRIYDAGTEVDEQPGLGEDQPLNSGGELNVGDDESEPIAEASVRHGESDLFVPAVDQLVRVRVFAVEDVDDVDDGLEDLLD